MKDEGLEGVATVPTPALQSKVITSTPARCATADNSTILDQQFAADKDLQALQNKLQKKYQMPM